MDCAGFSLVHTFQWNVYIFPEGHQNIHPLFKSTKRQADTSDRHSSGCCCGLDRSRPECRRHHVASLLVLLGLESKAERVPRLHTYMFHHQTPGPYPLR